VGSPPRLARVSRAAALAAAAALAFPALAQKPGVSAEAHARYQSARDSVAQIRVLLGASESHSATGTGFVVGRGLILTNYHVVSDKALEPDVYRLESVLPGGRRGPLKIVAVDVIHDLAVVKADTGDVRALAFRDGPLSKGEKGFSLGYPLNQGLSVVEGIYNGRSEEQYYETIHFTGAVNPGMSGGPVVDSAGRVFGVNVATRRRGQLVSFLVPAKFARSLLERAAVAGDHGPDFSSDIGAQLNAHGKEVMGALLKAPLRAQKLGEFDMPAKIGDFMQCGAGTERETDQKYTVDTYRCYTFSSLYIDGRISTGMVSFRYSILRAKELGALRFAYLQQSRFGANTYEGYDRKHYTRWSCKDEIVALQGTRAKAAICVRRYKRFEGLYDVALRIATLGDPALALHTELEMEGVPFDPAMQFSKRYVEAIKWNR